MFNRNMADVLIVGAGIAGLSLADHLKRRGFTVTGIEKEPQLGGRSVSGHQRLYSPEARDYLTEFFPGLQWREIAEAAVQFKKGEWGPLPEELSPQERFYTSQPFFHPKADYADLINQLVGRVGCLFQMRSQANVVDLAAKKITCLNGVEYPFTHLVWTSDLVSIVKACGRPPIGLKKKKAPGPALGGLLWDITVSQPAFEQENTIVFPFRYKDLKLRALGIRAGWGEGPAFTHHWLLFLQDTLLENREELAKVARAFKRELARQFPILSNEILSEKLAFHPTLPPQMPTPVPSLELYDGVVCVGADIRTEEVSPVEHSRQPMRNLDVVLRNCLDFIDLALPRWTETSPAAEQPGCIGPGVVPL